MRKSILTITLALVAVLAVLCSPTVASAAEDTGVYYLKYTQMSTTGNFANQLATWDFSEIHANVPLYMYLTEMTAGISHADGTGVYNLLGIDEDAEYVEARSVYTVGTYSRSGTQSSLTGSGKLYPRIAPKQMIIDYLSTGDCGYQIYMLSYETDIPIFDSRESLLAYLESGDDSGQLNKPQIDYSVKHDFTKDVYSADIPIPELSNINYNGFVVDNIGDYYLDVLVETEFLGVKYVENRVGLTKEWNCEPNTNWIYSSHSYNLSSDVLDVAYNSSKVNILDMYGIDIMADYVEDFKAWSVEYPKGSYLPDYSWQKLGTSQTQYSLLHVYNNDESVTDDILVQRTKRAQVTYYVRFYDSNGVNGQWVSYTYRCGFATFENDMNGYGALISGLVDIDNNGNAYVKDEVFGQVGEDGTITYNTAIDDATMDDSLQGFMDALNRLGESTSGVSDFVGSVFSFLPWWATAILGLAVGAVVILRFLGR